VSSCPRYCRDEHDLDLLRRMMAAIERGHMPSARGKASVSKAVLNVIENVHTHRREKALPGTKRGRNRAGAK
jgi:hypothetical protein